jgi:hypothetical protein
LKVVFELNPEFHSFCESLAQNRSLTHFGLKSYLKETVEESEKIFEILVGSISNCLSLTSLSFRNSYCLGTISRTKLLSQLLPSRTQLRLESIDFHCASVSRESLPDVVSLITSFTSSLKTVDLSWSSCIDQSSAHFVSKIIKGCPRLENLYLHRSSVNSDSYFMMDLKIALENAKTLQILSLPALPLENAKSLKKVLKLNRSLLGLVVSFNRLIGSYEQTLIKFLQFLEVNPVLQALRILLPGHTSISSSNIHEAVQKMLTNNDSFCELVVHPPFRNDICVRKEINYSHVKFSCVAPLIMFMKKNQEQLPLMDFEQSLRLILKFCEFPESASDYWGWQLAHIG